MSDMNLSQVIWCFPNSKQEKNQEQSKCMNNQLEKLEAAKAALIVCLSLLSLTGFFLVLIGPS